MNKATEQALRTWYPEDHPLHNDLHHPLGKLVGEWGELLDDYMKHLYKPDYEWQPIDELVDIWYYIRILAYQLDMDLKPLEVEGDTSMIDYLISSAILEANHSFRILISLGYSPSYYHSSLQCCYTYLVKICQQFDITLDDLTEASWDKLKPGSERGEEWMKARENDLQGTEL